MVNIVVMFSANATQNSSVLSNNFRANKKNSPAYVKTAAENIGVLVIDDQSVVRVGLQLLLEDTPGMRPVGEAYDMETARATIANQTPDVILLDLLTRDESALEFLPELIQAAPLARIIMLTCCREPEMHHRAIALGARPDLEKPAGGCFAESDARKPNANSVRLSAKGEKVNRQTECIASHREYS